VPIAANAVIGTIITTIWQPGDGSRITKIGQRTIDNVIEMIKFIIVFINVMVQRVLFMVVVMLVFFAFVMTTAKIDIFKKNSVACFIKTFINYKNVDGVIFKSINKCYKGADKK
jgi:hypothetical protein